MDFHGNTAFDPTNLVPGICVAEDKAELLRQSVSFLAG